MKKIKELLQFHTNKKCDKIMVQKRKAIKTQIAWQYDTVSKKRAKTIFIIITFHSIYSVIWQ